MVEATEVNNSTFNRMDKVTTSELQRRMATQALVPKKFGKRLVNALLSSLEINTSAASELRLLLQTQST